MLSAAILIPLAIGCIWMGGAAFSGLAALITAGLAYEWLGLCKQPTRSRQALPFVTLPSAVVLTALGQTMVALLLVLAAAALAALLSRGRPARASLVFGLPYLGLGAVALVWLRQTDGTGGTNVMILLLIVWASDIGAYMVGRTVGGPRLAPAISPGKTWSGAVGGLAAAAATGFMASVWLGGPPPFWRSAGLAVLIGVIGQIGDLFESLLKRHFGVKDSGNMIPGHGGLLDRLDAVLTAAPAASLLALILGRGVVLWK